MGVGGRSAEDWAGRRTVAEKVAAALIAMLVLGLAIGGPPFLRPVAAGVGAASAISGVCLLVIERRARGRALGALSGANGAPAPRVSHRTAAEAGGVDGVSDDARVVFVVCAREDHTWRRKFEIVLKPLADEGLVVLSEERVAVERVWDEELERTIARADAALVLVSPELLASEFAMSEELPALRARGIPLGFVHVRASLAGQAGVLAGVQWAHNPARSLQAADDPDGEIVRICQWLASLLPVRAPLHTSEPREDGRDQAARRVPRLVRSERMGDLHGVPPPATGEVERVERMGLRDTLLSAGEGTVGITGRSRAVGLHGQGGIGKTVLAAALARDGVVRRCFPEGIFWVTVGERGDVVALQLALLERLGAARPELRSREAAAGALRDALVELRCLLVVDDVWTVAAAAAFDVTGPLGRVLYTTRDEDVLQAVGAQVRRVDVLPECAARTLLAGLAQERVDALPTATDRVLTATGRVALALALVGAAVGRGGRDWDQVADELEDARKTFLDHPYADVFKAMQVAVAALDNRLAAAYRTLAVYPQDERVPITAVARLWAHVEATTAPKQTRLMLERLAARELLVLDGDAISFHDLQHEFLLLRADDMRLAHDELLAAYRALLPKDDPRWHHLPLDEPYIWEHLLDHLRGAAEVSGVYAVATDLAYLATRCARDGAYAVESDLHAAAQLHRDDAAIDWIINIFTRSAYLPTGSGATPSAVAAALAIRAQDPPAPVKLAVLHVLTNAPLLVPRWGLPDIPSELLRTLKGHTKEVSAVSFSPDGRLLASGGSDGTVLLWDPASSQLIRTIRGHVGVIAKFAVTTVTFSPDGRLLASAAYDRRVRLWDPASGRLIRTFEGGSAWVGAVAFSPDGSLLASVSGGFLDAMCVRLWDAASGKLIGILGGHASSVTAVAFSPDGRLLASAAADGMVRLWDPATCVITRTLKGHIGRVGAVAFSPDGRLLASSGYDRTVRLWDFASGQLIRTLTGHTGLIGSVAFSPDGRLLASATNGRAVRLWDLASGQLSRVLTGHAGRAGAVAFSPDGTLLASTAADGIVRLWDPAGRSIQRTFEGHTREVSGVAFSPDGRLLASASKDRTVRLWDPATGQLTSTLTGHFKEANAVACSPGGRLLASASKDRTVRLWDPVSGRLARILKGHTGEVSGVAFSPDGGLLASASFDSTVRLWDLASGQLTRVLNGHIGRVSAVTFSPDGTVLASAGYDSTVRLWNVASGERTCTLKGHAGRVSALEFSPDGTLLASAAHDRTVRLWDRRRGSWGRPAWGLLQRRRWASARLRGEEAVRAIAFLPDGRTLASASEDTIMLWDVAGHRSLWRARTGIPISGLAPSTDGIAAAMGTTIAVFNIIDGSPRRTTFDVE